jgi:2-polyprenyl-3-methyl-5-hydroxy-6-metoxy-1,4-benzoquinol methylase
VPDASYFESERFALTPSKLRYLEYLVSLLQRESVRPPARVLEIGAGTGLFAMAAERAGYDVTGIEASSHAVDVASGRVRGTMICHDANRPLDLADASFDAAVMFDVIEHLHDYPTTLSEAFRVLRPGGLVVVITLNAFSVVRPLLGRRWSWHQDPTHVVLFSSRSLRQAMRDAGFETIAISTIFNFFSAGESTGLLRPLRRLGAVWRVPCCGDSLLATGRR